jgi:hypothetical protein
VCSEHKHKHKIEKKVCLKKLKNSNIIRFKSDLSKIINFKENLFVKTLIFSVVFFRKKFGQFGQNFAKSSQTLEKDSQPRGLVFHSKKLDLLKQEKICNNRFELDFKFWPQIFINRILRHGIFRIFLTKT